MTRKAVQDELDELGVPEPSASEKRSAEEFIEQVERNQGLSVEIQARKDRNRKLVWDGPTAMRHAGIDPVVWKVDKCQVSHYQTTISGKKSHRKRDTTYQMVSVRLTCKRRFSESIMSAVDELAKRVHKRPHKLPALRRRRPRKDASTLVIGLTDSHIGKLAAAEEVGANYDIKIARELFTRAVHAAIARCRDENVQNCILPIGSDWLHVDGRQLQTEKGTPMAADFDGRFGRMIAAAEESMVDAIACLREVCPVDLIHIPGNHDPSTSMLLARCMYWAFKGDKHVSVDTAANNVKYRHFGKCLLGFAHGDGPKAKALLAMMPIQRPKAWGEATACREFLTGHLHHEKTVERISTQEQDGIKLRVLPSLCATDRFHYTSGFSMSKRATQCLVYSHRYGLKTVFTDTAESLMGDG